MKHKFLIVLIAIVVSSFTNEIFRYNSRSIENNKVLLIEYSQESNFEILKDYKRKKKRYHFIACIPSTSNNFNNISKMFYVEETIPLTDSSKVIFWESDTVIDVALPFQHLHLTLDRFINDSIVHLTLNNKKYICSPGQDLFDTIISIETEGKRVTKYTAIFHVNNHGLIFRKNIITERERMRRIYEELRIRDSIDLDDLERWEKKK